MNPRERKKAAKEFIKRWENRGAEKKDSQSFWLDLLNSVFNIEHPSEYITFEDEVMMDNTSFTDGYIQTTNVLIEQKGKHRDLNKGLKQSDGSFLTPFQQAKRYSANLPYSRRPRWIITCNFSEFFIYDMESPNAEPSIVKLQDLYNEYYRLEILVDKTNTQIEKETEISIKAGELIGQIYDELLLMYKDPENPHTLASINQLCVRLVFCFYAEDAELFGRRGMFKRYLIDFDTRFFRNAIVGLFKILNTKIEERDPYLDDKLAEFPFVNGGLFEDMNIEIPQFTDHLRDLIIKNASSDFDWSEISPTIFGGVFESTLNPDTRREGGMHYTSIENIHKVIDPLFLDDLKNELNQIRQMVQPATIARRTRDFQRKLSNLHFFDPACGSGNFLTETYMALRELENEAIKLRIGDYFKLDIKQEKWIYVTLDQFSGVEINDFAVSVARTALWIGESQMFEKTKDLVFAQDDFFPITSHSKIVEGNALMLDWEELVDKSVLNYIIGNPPFLGHSLQNAQQKKDMRSIYTDLNNKEYRLAGKIDYVAGWYFKAAQFIKNTKIEVAFVSTNSITQGEQVEGVWKPLYERFNIRLNFAYRTFKWKSEATNKANVFVVIIGFSHESLTEYDKKIFNSDNSYEIVSNITPYLLEGEVIIVESKLKPLNKISPMIYGSKPTDGGFFFLTPEEKKEIINKEPQSEKFIRRVYGAREFINNIERYCLWLKDIQPDELRNTVILKDRVKKVKEFRLTSKAASTRKFADYSTRFKQDAQPLTNYLIVPRVSSENRRYIPIGFMSPDNIATDALQIIPEASLYEFGIITSNVHMGWMRTVSGRLKSDYRYSSTLVYNTFPWPDSTLDQRKKIEETAQSILNARALYPESNFADLYDELSMPLELRRAHQNNDRAVMQSYGMSVGSTSESKSVEKLFELYKIQVSQLK